MKATPLWYAVGLYENDHRKVTEGLPKDEHKKSTAVAVLGGWLSFLYPLGESNPHLKFRKLPFYPLN